MAPGKPPWRRYLRFWRPSVRAQVDDELAFHVQETVDDLMLRGRSREEAEREALDRFGNLTAVKDTCREIAQHNEADMRRTEYLAAAAQDVTYSVRLLRKYPSLTAAIVLTLALGIGATTAVFSVVNAVLLRPLPYENGERIVSIVETVGATGRGRASIGHFTDWTEQTKVFAATSAFQFRTVNLTEGEPERVLGARVTPGFFVVSRMTPALGRYFRADESDASRVVVLSHGLWQTRFSGDSSIVGREVTLSGERHTVIGVTPREYTLTRFDERLWTPVAFTPEQRANYGAHQWQVFARLRDGVTLAQVQGELKRVTDDIAKRNPANMIDRGVDARPLSEALTGDYRLQLFVLLGAVTAVLLIGCGNVASLLLARNAARRKEMAIRGALGGGRGRLVRQLLTESVVLALVGGALGVGVARLGVRFLVGMGPAGLPRLGEAGLHPEVLGFALAATCVCALLFGVAPALRATRTDLESELRAGGRGSQGAVNDRLRSALIVTEIAVSLVLLVSATLLIKSGYRLQQVALGFEPEGVTMMRVALPADRYDSASAISMAFSGLVERVRAIPGVKSAAAGTRVPMWGATVDIGVTVDGRVPDPKRVLVGHVRVVTPGFTETIGVPLRQGRTIAESDLAAGAPRVVVVNETFAKNVFPAGPVLGQRISGWTNGPTPEWREIVGVVGDVRAFGQDNDMPPEIYFPLTQAPSSSWATFQRGMTIVVKAPPGSPVGAAMRAAVRAVDPLLPTFDLQTMDDVLSQATATRRFNTILLSLLGLTGLLLAAIGISGVISFFVSQRTHEFGIRVALGATTGNVMRLVVRQAVVLATLGVVLGGVMAFWTTRAIARMLFQVDARDPMAFAVGAATLILVALAAASVPARRAARMDPTKALTG